MRTAIAWIITVVWAAMYTRKLVEPGFPVPAEITPVMLIVAGYFFGKDIKDKLTERVKKVGESENGK